MTIDIEWLNLHRQWSPEQKDQLIALARKGQQYDATLHSGEYFRDETVKARERAEVYEQALRHIKKNECSWCYAKKIAREALEKGK